MQFRNVPEGEFHELLTRQPLPGVLLHTYFRFSNRFLLWFLICFFMLVH